MSKAIICVKDMLSQTPSRAESPQNAMLCCSVCLGSVICGLTCLLLGNCSHGRLV